MRVICGNPVGTAHEEKVLTFVESLAKIWLVEKDKEAKPKWWQFWKNRQLTRKAVQFLLNSVDILIQYVDDLIYEGPDKKATVLAALSALYDLIIKDLLPFWIKPFATGVKVFVIYTVLSLMIDFIVQKYHAGVWNKEENVKDNDPK